MEDAEFDATSQSGAFSPEDLYWREGMAVWLPIPNSQEEEAEWEPEALIARIRLWTRIVRPVFLAGAVFATMGLLVIPFFQSDLMDSSSLAAQILGLLSIPVIIGYGIVGFAIYIVPAFWLYYLCSGAATRERPSISPLWVAFSWCVPLANMVLPIIGIISAAKALRIRPPQALWIVVGASAGGLLFAIIGLMIQMSESKSYFVNFLASLWLAFDAVKYLAWRNITSHFPEEVEAHIRQTQVGNPEPDTSLLT